MADQNTTNVTNATEQQDLGELLQIRRDKLKALQDEGRDPFQITKFDVTHHAQEIKDDFDALEGTVVRVAGRLMSKRGMGKVSFCDMQDKSGRIQIYARKDEMDEDTYNRFKKYDIGDIVGVVGEVFRTQRGEMSVRAREITLLSKSLRPLPEKFHGLTDKEARYRQRYVDFELIRIYRRFVNVGVFNKCEHQEARNAISEMNMINLATLLEQNFDVFKQKILTMNDQELGQKLLNSTSEAIFKNIQIKFSQFLEG